MLSRLMLAERASRLEDAVNSTPLATGRIAYTVLGLLSLILVSNLLGLKISQTFFSFASPKVQKLTPLNLIILALYIDTLFLLFVELLFSSGITFTNAATCTATGVLDTLFFFGSKVLLQLFLLERLRIARRALHHRWRDPLFVVPLAILGTGFVALGILGFRFLRHAYYESTNGAGGSCSVGFPYGVSVALLAFDVFASFGVTGLFLWALRDAMRASRNSTVSAVLGRVSSRLDPRAQRDSWKKLFVKTTASRIASEAASDIDIALVASSSEEELGQQQSRSAAAERVVKLIRKTLLGALITYIPFSINIAMLVSLKGMEQGWFCFITCTLDTTCSVCVVHWLTSSNDDK